MHSIMEKMITKQNLPFCEQPILRFVVPRITNPRKNDDVNFILFSDVHGNIEAFSQFTECIEYFNNLFDRNLVLVGLGDYIDYGPDSDIILKSLQQLKKKYETYLISGNHDAIACELLNPTKCKQENFGRLKSVRGKISAILTADQIKTKSSKEDIAFLQGLSIGFAAKSRKLFDWRFDCFHGSPKNPMWGSCIDDVTKDDMKKFVKHQFIFGGHTHKPCVRIIKDAEDGKQYAINVGSIGQPRNGNPLGNFCLFEVRKTEFIISVYSFNYDFKTTAEKILRNPKQDKYYANRLMTGN